MKMLGLTAEAWQNFEKLAFNNYFGLGQFEVVGPEQIYNRG